MANEIVWYHSEETGAPVLNNAAGALDAVLYACLVTGFRTQTLTGVAVAANVAAATLAGHGYADQMMVEISGATPGGVNGRKRITVTGSGTFTFPTTGVADGAATGTIVAKRSPLGWTRPLNSGNVSMYARSDVSATGMKLRVDDSNTGVASATAARARMVESYSDLNPTTGLSPTDAQLSGGQYWTKGADTAAAKMWVLVGDGKTFYLFTDASSYPAASYSNVPHGVYGFGDIEPYRAGDAYACFIAGAGSASNPGASALGNLVGLAGASSSYECVLPRPFNGIGGAVRAAMTGTGATGGNRRIGGGGPAYPSPVDNGLLIHYPALLSESNTTFQNPLRGHLRGLGDPLALLAGGALHKQVFTTVVGSDRAWLLVGFNQQGSYGHAAFDLTGPW